MEQMTTTVSRRAYYVPVLVAAVLLSMTATQAVAGDAGKILGALAAGYVAYEILDSLGDIRDAVRAPSYCPPPPPRYDYPYQRYDPPPAYYDGGEARFWYREGYRDGFKDGNQCGYANGFQDGYGVGYQDGDRNGFRRGVRTGYRIGYGDGYDDGHWDGFVQGRQRGRR